MKRDIHWKGAPPSIHAWAALNRDGQIMAASIRDRPEDVKLSCGECVPIRVTVRFEEEENE